MTDSLSVQFIKYRSMFIVFVGAFSITWPASMLIYWNKRKFLHKKRVQLSQDCLGTPTCGPPFHCFGTPIWPSWRQVKTLFIISGKLGAEPLLWVGQRPMVLKFAATGLDVPETFKHILS